MAGPTGGTTGPPWQDNTVPRLFAHSAPVHHRRRRRRHSFPVCLPVMHLCSIATALLVAVQGLTSCIISAATLNRWSLNHLGHPAQ